MNKIIIFCCGVYVGSVITQQYFKKKYEQLAQEEIDSVKKEFGREKPAENYIFDDEDKRKCEEIIAENNYISKDSGKEERGDNMPYVISPDEFSEIEDYETISLTYYSDDILTDEDDEPVENIDETVGSMFSSYFGEYEDDSVFVRNDRLKCDYEILLDQRKYSEVLKTKPTPVKIHK
ncbi:MAG: hypothetical protein LUD77_06675 [Clostridiales bacterium]|nr:hypothetical protein [Clostridiales bacterium]